MEDFRMPHQATEWELNGYKREPGTTKDKLDGQSETPPEEHEHHMGRSQGTGGRQDRMESTYGQMHPTRCGINRTEQKRREEYIQMTSVERSDITWTAGK